MLRVSRQIEIAHQIIDRPLSGVIGNVWKWPVPNVPHQRRELPLKIRVPARQRRLSGALAYSHCRPKPVLRVTRGNLSRPGIRARVKLARGTQHRSLALAPAHVDWRNNARLRGFLFDALKVNPKPNNTQTADATRDSCS